LVVERRGLSSSSPVEGEERGGRGGGGEEGGGGGEEEQSLVTLCLSQPDARRRMRERGQAISYL
jgi:hypothetical protein